MIHFKIIFNNIRKASTLCLLCAALSSCLGGTIAQQIVRSVATSVADKALARAMDVDEDQLDSNRSSGNRKPDYSNPVQNDGDDEQNNGKNEAAPSSVMQANNSQQKTSKITPNTAFNDDLTNIQVGNKPFINQQSGYKPSGNKQSGNKQSINAQTPLQRIYAKQNAEKRKLIQDNASNIAAQQIENDPYKLAIANTAFEKVDASVAALPSAQSQLITTAKHENINAPAGIKTNQLVRVELFNVLIGSEKAAIYEKARLVGATQLPNARDWAYWQVAIGEIKGEIKSAIKSKINSEVEAYATSTENPKSKLTPATNNKQITFLIPPHFGKLTSGSITMVELANPGELNIARYKTN